MAPSPWIHAGLGAWVAVNISRAASRSFSSSPAHHEEGPVEGQEPLGVAVLADPVTDLADGLVARGRGAQAGDLRQGERRGGAHFGEVEAALRRQAGRQERIAADQVEAGIGLVEPAAVPVPLLGWVVGIAVVEATLGVPGGQRGSQVLDEDRLDGLVLHAARAVQAVEQVAESGGRVVSPGAKGPHQERQGLRVVEGPPPGGRIALGRRGPWCRPGAGQWWERGGRSTPSGARGPPTARRTTGSRGRGGGPSRYPRPWRRRCRAPACGAGP